MVSKRFTADSIMMCALTSILIGPYKNAVLRHFALKCKAGRIQCPVLSCVFPNTIIHQIFENGKTRSLLFSPLGATNGLEISRLG